MRQPVVGALCLTVAAESVTPGRDRSFVDHLDDEVLDQYSQAAENAEVWLILQIQHRRGGAYEAVQKWAHWLERPHVGVFLDGDSDTSGPSDDIAEAVSFLEALVDTKRPPSKPVLITGNEQVMSGTHPTKIIQLHQVDSLPTSVEAGTWTILV
jgi:hypothetical protein